VWLNSQKLFSEWRHGTACSLSRRHGPMTRGKWRKGEAKILVGKSSAPMCMELVGSNLA